MCYRIHSADSQYESANQRGPILVTHEDTFMCNEILTQTSSVDLLFW